ncbi:hypothetical protein AAVH_11804 [Aphelenchoides avenae]|nr:hypothetical protein AAVH_36616 [Aphelenchus avenae]KAH7720751.1 hypothetical protein AAVH_11804 [Aphelenchus avenae]
MGLCCSQCDEEPDSTDEEAQISAVDETQESAVVKASSIHAIDGDLRFERSLPRHNFIQDLIEDFRQSSSPECMRPVTFHPGKTLREYVSASCHLPGAYADFFPCPHCTSEDEEGRTSLVEVFHFANVHTPNLCATAKFIMSANDAENVESTECRIEVDFRKGCPCAPIAVDHSPLAALHIATDVFIEVLCFLPRTELEKMMLVSRRWSNVIERAARTLRQRRDFFVCITFHGERPGMLSVQFFRCIRSAREYQWTTLRVLTTRGLSQALNAVRSHLRNAFVKRVVPIFGGRVPAPDPPPEMLVDIPFSARIHWLKSMLRSMPSNSEIGEWFVADANIGTDNFLTVASCAMEQQRKLACMQDLYVGLLSRNATWARLASVLNQSSIRSFSEIAVSTTRIAIDTSELRVLLSSWQSQKLHIHVESGTEPQDGLLTLPVHIIRDFLALSDANSFIAEFSLAIEKPDNIAFAEMPHVSEATDRRKRFWCQLQGEDTEVRVSIYKNRAANEHLTVVTFDHFRRTVLFFKGNVPLADLWLTFQRPYVFH